MLPLFADIEGAVVNLERRGHTLDSYLQKANPEGLLPSYHVQFAGKEFWFHSQADVDAFRAEQAKKLGKELVLSNDLAANPSEPEPPTAPGVVAPTVPHAERYTQDDWHEVRVLNRAIGKLMELGFQASDLVPLPRIAGREPPVRFIVEHGDVRRDLPHLLMLVAEIRKFGEKGISVTRFKGLGEMDPEELWATTLDPQYRTLLKVTLTDAMAAEKEFRRLMGEDVDGRRRFIFDKPLNNPEDIDYGA
jgi:DNA gyrase subunit B